MAGLGIRDLRCGLAGRYARLTLLVAVFVGCGGCVPVYVHRYYRPAATGGDVLSDSCWRTANTVRFIRPHLDLRLRVVKAYRSEDRFVQLQWEVAPGHTVELSSDEAHLFVSERSEPLIVQLHLSESSTAGFEHIPIRPMVGGYLAAPAQGYVRNYWMYLPLPPQIGGAFRVRLPRLTIDDEPAAAPALLRSRHLRPKEVPRGDSCPAPIPEVLFERVRAVQFLAPLQC